jgi:uncharacterized membrane protein YphA (DoxX/SURF4 family)
MNSILIYAFLLLLVFLISGYEKLFIIKDTANSLQNKLNWQFIPSNLYILAIIIVVIIELVCPSIILYSLHTNTYKQEAFYSCLALVGFTILATLIYHNPALSQKEYYNFLKNVSIIGGLLILSNNFN